MSSNSDPNRCHQHHHGNHDDHQCRHQAGVGGVHQTLDEMDFQRGPCYPASNGDYPAIKRYLERGGNPSACDSAGYTPLHYAVRGGHVEMTRELLASGCDVKAITKASGSTPLHRVASTPHHHITKLLLHHKSDPRMQDIDGRTPLHLAVINGRTENVRLMLEHDRRCGEISDKHSKLARDYIDHSHPPELLALFT